MMNTGSVEEKTRYSEEELKEFEELEKRAIIGKSN